MCLRKWDPFLSWLSPCRALFPILCARVFQVVHNEVVIVTSTPSCCRHIREELFFFSLILSLSRSISPIAIAIAIHANLCMRTDSENDFLRILSGGIRPNDRADIGQSLCAACRVRKFYPKEKWSSKSTSEFGKWKCVSILYRREIDWIDCRSARCHLPFAIFDRRIYIYPPYISYKILN